ncbi:hypothetical protein DCAR_0626077 [Daucus carota subsp. sativus]|uniref:Uncharacterized protein n=1 Tax=Daucus carota subsp. sativus TaxID=79200 RepID=A0A161YGU1_DAUCS|nr:hypothetical protein DCAR_0626077 [Daucus carota subsp. sativus]
MAIKSKNLLSAPCWLLHVLLDYRASGLYFEGRGLQENAHVCIRWNAPSGHHYMQAAPYYI